MSAVELSGARLGLRGRLPRPPRPSLRLLAVSVALLALGGGGLLWLRDSPLVSVDHVVIRGLSGAGAGDIRDALTRAAQGMSTLDLNPSRLRAAVAPFHIVRGLRLATGFPHRLSIVVDERPAVALIAGPGGTVPAAADGTLLQGAPLPSSLPIISLPTGIVGTRVEDPGTRAELTVLGGAPSALRAHLTRVFRGPGGITAALRSGPDVIFGDASLPHAKWQAAERVLADAGALGISYIDVREPSRPAAGVPAASATSPSAPSAGSIATGAALDQALQAAATGVPASPSPGAASVAASTPVSPAAGPGGTAAGSARVAPAGASATAGGAAGGTSSPAPSGAGTGGSAAAARGPAGPGAAAGGAAPTGG